MVAKINQNWNSRQSAAGITTMQFTIQRDGMLTDIKVLRSSGNQMLDFLANRALLAVRQLPPLGFYFRGRRQAGFQGRRTKGRQDLLGQPRLA